MKRHLTILCAGSVFSAAATSGQIGIANSFAAMNVGSNIITDDAGNVVKFAVSRHAAKDTAAMPPGVGDAESGDILKLPKLEAVFIEMMPLSDASYALLGQLKSLNDVRIHTPRSRSRCRTARRSRPPNASRNSSTSFRACACFSSSTSSA